MECELEEPANVGDLHRRILTEFPAMADAIERVRTAVNEDYADSDRPLRDGDVVAFIPPVSGG